MRLLFFATIAMLAVYEPTIFSQTPDAPKLYSHKVEVLEILQTKSYTYLNVKEQLSDRDSLMWLALPLFEPAIGEIYYFNGGLQMGEFQSKELNRTFNEILFLGGLSTSPEISESNIVSGMKPSSEDSSQNIETPGEIHTVIVKEVLQTSGYTYLRVTEGEKENWLAVVKVNAVVGQTYTYDDAAMMTDFTSKELKRTFKEVLFVANLKKAGADAETKASPNSHGLNYSGDSSSTKSLNAEEMKGDVSIATLLENSKDYAGKKIKVKGEVTKYSSDILTKNWIHIKDGTTYAGKSDLTITTDASAEVGDIIVVEGMISLDKDFGSGYFFDVIMESAKVLNK